MRACVTPPPIVCTLLYSRTRVQAQPNYFTCVRLVTTAALNEMRLPGLLTVAMPVTVGLLFRWIGELQGKPLLGYVVTVRAWCLHHQPAC
ncbi:hypothetical protein EON62_00180 [archaeon]|nr:MAG: hypothetical protein EON62_00180 [archaeon]